MKFAPDYIACVLNDVFEDAKAQFLSPLMAIHYAHLVMLVDQGIVSPADGRALAVALDSIDLDAVRQWQIGDIFLNGDLVHRMWSPKRSLNATASRSVWKSAK